MHTIFLSRQATTQIRVAVAWVLSLMILLTPGALVWAEETASSTPVVEAGAATVVTGDAATIVEGETTTNTVDLTASSTATSSMIVDNTSAASTTNETAATSTTGDNTASSTATSTIGSGDAYAGVNLVNLSNTNFINSRWAMWFLNNIFSAIRSIDLRTFFAAGTGPSWPGSLTLQNTNSGTTTNEVDLLARTGGNAASGTTAQIGTGNAYAEANIVNMANTNVVNSQYLLMVFNNFGSWDGDLILPAGDFWTGAPYAGSLAATNTSSTTIENNVEAGTETGSNQAAGGEATVTTGQAYTGGAAFNQVNTNEIGGSSLMVLFRIHGAWNGKIYNAPSFASLANVPLGFEIVGSDSGDPSNVLSGLPETYSISALNTDTSYIGNSVRAYAITGENSATGTGQASIGTGNAYAAINLVNMVNTNILGRNWLLAIVNIFGDWTGSISFGQPNLWAGIRAETPNGVSPGQPVTYHYTITNHGDAPASGLEVKSLFNNQYISWTGEGSGTWSIPSIAPGETVQLSAEAKLAEHFLSGETEVINTLKVTAREPDADTTDNTDQAVLSVIMPADSWTIGPGPAPAGSDPEFTITKTANASTTASSSTITYVITLKNHGGVGYNTLLVDELKNEAGTVVSRHEWPLEQVLAGETITVTYSMEFGSTTPPGRYSNFAQVESWGGALPGNGGHSVTPVSASTTITVLPVSQPLMTAATSTIPAVLGMTTPRAPVLFEQALDEDYLTHVLASSEDGLAAAGTLNIPFWLWFMGLGLLVLGLAATYYVRSSSSNRLA